MRRGTSRWFVRADEIRGRPDLDIEAIGNVELRRADVRLRADRLSYDVPTDLARASGNVRACCTRAMSSPGRRPRSR